MMRNVLFALCGVVLLGTGCSMTNKQDVAVNNEKEIVTTSCPKGYTLYPLESIDFSLCIVNSLAAIAQEKETELSAEMKKGTEYYITFPRSEAMVTVSTTDFAKLGDSDAVGAIKGYDCLVNAQDNSALEKCFVDQVIDVRSSLDPKGRKHVEAIVDVDQLDGTKERISFVFVPDILKDGSHNLQMSLPMGAGTIRIKDLVTF